MKDVGARHALIKKSRQVVCEVRFLVLFSFLEFLTFYFQFLNLILI